MNKYYLRPIILSVIGYKIIKDKIAVAIKPLYKAPIIFLLEPRRNKKSSCYRGNVYKIHL